MLSQKNKKVNLTTATKTKLTLDESMSLQNLSALNSCIVPGSYHFTLKGQFNTANNKPLLDAALKGQVVLICQRSLEAFDYPINVELKLGFVTDDRFFKDFPEGYEPYVYENEVVDIQALIEEEILLSIPMIPKKERKDCQTQQNTSYYGVLKTSAQKDTVEDNPFAVLKTLKFDKDRKK
ncbi:YceD family protein [Facilibium subflavum]|uniref:YceD family protein n=1 Tax=Facilibium subflavum TaxID=2219058 RepID=UPI000E646D16|nr:DUF177 domain-containing protein [Facilibium subflavum]